jgi:excisionase family DNA binding protein
MPWDDPMAIPETSPSAPVNPAYARRKKLNAEQAAEYLNVSVRTIHYWLRDGKIPGHRIGKFLRFDADELDAARNRF